MSSTLAVNNASPWYSDLFSPTNSNYGIPVPGQRAELSATTRAVGKRAIQPRTFTGTFNAAKQDWDIDNRPAGLDINITHWRPVAVAAAASEAASEQIPMVGFAPKYVSPFLKANRIHQSIHGHSPAPFSKLSKVGAIRALEQPSSKAVQKSTTTASQLSLPTGSALDQPRRSMLNRPLWGNSVQPTNPTTTTGRLPLASQGVLHRAQKTHFVAPIVPKKSEKQSDRSVPKTAVVPSTPSEAAAMAAAAAANVPFIGGGPVVTRLTPSSRAASPRHSVAVHSGSGEVQKSAMRVFTFAGTAASSAQQS